jgi:hypothetical protein
MRRSQQLPAEVPEAWLRTQTPFAEVIASVIDEWPTVGASGYPDFGIL